MVVLGLYVASSILMWLQGYVLNGVVQRTVLRLRADVEDKLHRPAAALLRQEAARRAAQPGHQRHRQHPADDAADDEPAAQLAAHPGRRPGDDALDLAAARARRAGLGAAVDPRDARRSPSGRSRCSSSSGASPAQLNAHIEETYTGHALVKVFGHQSEAEEQFADRNDELYQASFGAQFISGIIMPAIMFIGNLNYVFIAVIGGLQGGVGQHVARRRAGLHPVLPPVQPAADPGGVDVEPAAVRCRVRRAGLRPARRGGAVARPGAPRGPRRPARAGRVRRTCRSATTEDAPLIDDLSLVAEPGQTVAIVGPTGAGKTTLVNLIMRFYELDGGRITLDGVDIADVDARRAARRDRHGAAGHVAVRRHDPREHRVRPARARPRTRSSPRRRRRTWTGSSTRCPTATTR